MQLETKNCKLLGIWIFYGLFRDLELMIFWKCLGSLWTMEQELNQIILLEKFDNMS